MDTFDGGGDRFNFTCSGGVENFGEWFVGELGLLLDTDLAAMLFIKGLFETLEEPSWVVPVFTILPLMIWQDYGKICKSDVAKNKHETIFLKGVITDLDDFRVFR